MLVVGATSLHAQTKIAHVNSQQLLDTMPSRKQAIKEIQAFQAEGVAELDELENQGVVVERFYWFLCRENSVSVDRDYCDSNKNSDLLAR